jgi:hypothetical protein
MRKVVQDKRWVKNYSGLLEGGQVMRIGPWYCSG